MRLKKLLATFTALILSTAVIAGANADTVGIYNNIEIISNEKDFLLMNGSSSIDVNLDNSVNIFDLSRLKSAMIDRNSVLYTEEYQKWSNFNPNEIVTDKEYEVYTVNDNKPFFYNINYDSSFEYYSELDELGRCGVTISLLCKETLPTEERTEIGMIKPTGWVTQKYDFVNGKYLYNRCHLIGFQLSAENDNPKNLITGTRSLNIKGMLDYENLVANYIRTTDNHVLYRVTPVFKDYELLARGVIMEALSLEDNGEDICFNVFCPNYEKGVYIDYTDGSNYSDGTMDNVTTITTTMTTTQEPIETTCTTNPVTTSPQQTEPSVSTTTVENSEYPFVTCSIENAKYIANESTKKFHYPSCSSVKAMSDSNKICVEDKEILINFGYVPCGRCKP